MGDRKDPEQIRSLVDPSLYTCKTTARVLKELSCKLADVYDMNGRESSDTAPLADLFTSSRSELKVKRKEEKVEYD
eukprot:747754-Hanusia_phi.AAC.1